MTSSKMKGATERGKKAAAQQKERLATAAHKVEELAEQRGAEIRERVSEARRQAHRKDKHPAA